MTTFTEKISNIEVVVVDNLTNVIKKCKYSLTGTLDNRTVTSFKEVTLNDPVANDFIAFEELTEELVLSWVHDAMGLDEVEALKIGIEHTLQIPVDLSKQLTPVQTPWSK